VDSISQLGEYSITGSTLLSRFTSSAGTIVCVSYPVHVHNPVVLSLALISLDSISQLGEYSITDSQLHEGGRLKWFDASEDPRLLCNCLNNMFDNYQFFCLRASPYTGILPWAVQVGK
jgi:hypothetical protein